MIVAERTLHISSAAGDVPVPITIESPVFDRDAWICRYSISWPEGAVNRHAAAFDAVQALHFGLQRIAIELYASPHHHAGTLYFDAPGDGYGFPLPAGSRDLAIGSDKTL